MSAAKRGGYGSPRKKSPGAKGKKAGAPPSGGFASAKNGSVRRVEIRRSPSGSPAGSARKLPSSDGGAPTPTAPPKSALASPRKRDKRKGKHKRGVSFADEHNRKLAEVHEIERRPNAGRAPGASSGCCVVQ